VNFNVLLFPSILSSLLLVVIQHIYVLYSSHHCQRRRLLVVVFVVVCIIYCNRENDNYWIQHLRVFTDDKSENVTVSRQNVVFNGPYMSSGKSFHPSFILRFFLFSYLIRSKTQVAPFPCLQVTVWFPSFDFYLSFTSHLSFSS
jgi:hypothetical protein